MAESGYVEREKTPRRDLPSGFSDAKTLGIATAELQHAVSKRQ
jgi:hypothetical protein